MKIYRIKFNYHTFKFWKSQPLGYIYQNLLSLLNWTFYVVFNTEYCFNYTWKITVLGFSIQNTIPETPQYKEFMRQFGDSSDIWKQ